MGVLKGAFAISEKIVQTKIFTSDFEIICIKWLRYTSLQKCKMVTNVNFWKTAEKI